MATAGTPLLIGKPRSQEIVNPVVLIQTETIGQTHRAIDALRDPQIVTPADIVVFCNVDNVKHFRNHTGVKMVLTYRKGSPFDVVRAYWRLRKLNPDVVAAIFRTGPFSGFRKLLFYLFPAGTGWYSTSIWTVST